MAHPSSSIVQTVIAAITHLLKSCMFHDEHSAFIMSVQYLWYISLSSMDWLCMLSTVQLKQSENKTTFQDKY